MTKHIAVKHGQGAVPAITDSWKMFRQEIEHLFDRFSDGFDSFPLQPANELERLLSRSWNGFSPLAVDVVEGEKAYTVTAEFPGVEEKDLEVTVDDNTLVIKGEKHQNHEEKGRHRYMSERSYGSFQRMFGLPQGTDAAKIEAKFHNGILTVTVPKAAPAQNVRKVDVKAA
jgi:HSP20 family protein